MSFSEWQKQGVLSGNHIRLEPLEKHHLISLSKQFTSSLTDYYPQSLRSVDEYFNEVVGNKIFGEAQVFAIILVESGDAIGCSGYFNLAETHRRLEVGGTWIGKMFQGSVVNVESKLLLLDHAFNKMKCLRVEFKTDSLNERSQKALEKLGAVREGLLRNHMVRPDGRIRHSIYSSIIFEEWPKVRSNILLRIEEKLNSKTVKFHD